MNSGVRILKMTAKGVYISKEHFVPYEQTNLTVDQLRPFRDRHFYWKVKAVWVNQPVPMVQVQVLDHDCWDNATFYNQELKREIPFILFDSTRYHFEQQENSNLSVHTSRFGSFHRFEPVDPVEKIYIGTFTVKFSKATFTDGGIACRIYIKETNSEVDFSIPNIHLRKEHEAISEYICKRMGRKTFRILTIVKELGRKITSAEATSEDIANINEDFFQQLKVHLIKAKISPREDGRTLHTLKDVSDPFTIDLDEVIRIVTNDDTHRNSYSLHYLSGKHDLEQIVYMTLKPRFGFLFYLDGTIDHHYVWELLDSHATYVWSYPKADNSVSSALASTEHEISSILANGRITYKRNADDNSGQYRFNLIQHHNLASTGALDIIRWQGELSLITE